MHRGRLPADVLGLAQAARPLIQDYRPHDQSIEWNLGQHYFAWRGNQAFIGDARPVPFVINNDGALSARAAHLTHASLVAADRAGTLEPEIVVLELGLGVGLFARLFLDRFRDLCRHHDTDYYDRLIYVAADRSERMLADAARHGIFAEHSGHYLLRLVDALDPARGLADDAAIAQRGDRPFRAVFLNYLLDCLPSAILRIDDDDVRQLYIRTYLARGVALEDYTDLDLAEVARRADSADPSDKDALIPLYGLFASEYDYRPVDPGSIPYGDAAIESARGRCRHVLYNYGAVQCLERLLPMTRADGFVLINDYGRATLAEDDEHLDHQRFSRSTAIGLNFPLLRECLTGLGIPIWIEPEDDGHLYSRLLGRSIPPDLADEFRRLFGKASRQRDAEPFERAREYVDQGRFEMASGAYREALERQPWNWTLLSEAAKFLTFSLRDSAAGLTLDRAALALNPTCSPDLWNNFGDALSLLGRASEAHAAFRRALRINPEDARAHFNLACFHIGRQDYPSALRAIADGLAFDKPGHYWKGLLKMQGDALECIGRRNQQEGNLLINRVSLASQAGQPGIERSTPGQRAGEDGSGTPAILPFEKQP